MNIENLISYFSTLRNPVSGMYTDKGSSFYAYACHIRTEEEAMDYLDKVKDEHPKANHHCYAYSCGYDRNTFRMNDDGEPSGTAGKPIYGQILSHDLFHIIIVVVRYFGGTKLGVSGLIKAYKAATIEALKDAQIKKEYVSQKYEIESDYSLSPHLRDAFSELDIVLIDERYDEKAHYIVEIPRDAANMILKSIASRILNRSISDINDPSEEIEGLIMSIYEKE